MSDTEKDKTPSQRKSEELSSNPYSYESLLFPESIGNRNEGHTHYVLFNINETSHRFGTDKAGKPVYGGFGENLKGSSSDAAKAGKKSNIVVQGDTERNRNFNTSNGEALRSAVFDDETSSTNRISTSIALQMPDSAISASYAADWQTAELGAAAATKIRGLAAAGADQTGSVIERIKNTVAAGAGEEPLDVIGTALTPQDIEDVFLLLPERKAKNPRVEVLFRGIGNRTFQFQFKMSPTTSKEMETVKRIVEVFKFAMAPRLRNNDGLGAFFEFPDEFDIFFYRIDESGQAVENTNIHRISTCALTSFNVDYSSAGKFATFEDGNPVQVSIDLQFTELEILHKDRIREGY